MELKFLDHAKSFFEQNKNKSLAAALTGTWITSGMKGTQLKLFETTKTTQFADFILVATVQNPIQAGAISHQIIKTLKQFDLSVRTVEGSQESDWILIDMYDLVIHLFTPAAREIYALDELLACYKSVTIPQEFYTFAADQDWESISQSSNDTDDFKNYI